MYIDFKRVYANKAKAEFDNGVKHIKPTIFNKDYTINTKSSSSYIDAINTKVSFDKETINSDEFVKIHPLLISMLLGKGESVLAVLGFFIQSLNYNSNCIHATINEISSTMAISDKSVREGIDYLCYKKVIAKTTIQSEYIINHNIIFKGKIEDFVKAYNKLYDGKYAETDSKGKIIISKDIVKIEKSFRYSRKKVVENSNGECNNKGECGGDEGGEYGKDGEGDRGYRF